MLLECKTLHWFKQLNDELKNQFENSIYFQDRNRMLKSRVKIASRQLTLKWQLENQLYHSIELDGE